MAKVELRRNGQRFSRARLFRTCLVVVAMALLGAVTRNAHAQVPALAYDDQTRGPVPIPPSERSLQTVVAEPWFKVSNQGIIPEGPAFERNGNLVFCDVSGMRVLRVTPQKQLSTVVTLNGMNPGGLAIRKDGRLFIAAMNLAKGTGSILVVKPDGTGMRTIVPAAAGYMPNDLVLDSQGGFYFSFNLPGLNPPPLGGYPFRKAIWFCLSAFVF
jgi:lactonase